MRIVKRGLAIGIVMCAVAANSVLSETSNSELKTLETGDDTRGWEAVGRLNLGDNGFCTGALIDERTVLTAAHCLFDKTTGEPVNAGEIEFLASWRNGRAEAYRSVKRAVAHPDFEYSNSDNLSRVSNDVALLQLDRPIRNFRVQPFETAGRLRQGDTVGIVSYAQDRSEAPSLQDTCHVLERLRGVVLLTCSVDFGASGAPIFVLGDVPKIVSVVSAKAEMDGAPVALAAELRGTLDELRVALDAVPLASNLESRKSIKRGLPLAGTRSTTGAKFLRP
jgi:protease YdgD